jgi:hypothetical protein
MRKKIIPPILDFTEDYPLRSKFDSSSEHKLNASQKVPAACVTA